MKIGIPVFKADELPRLRAVIDKVDFLEIKAVRGNDYSGIERLGLPVIIHAEHSSSKVNFADPMSQEESIKSISFAISLADRFKAKHIIIHPEKVIGKADEHFLVRFLGYYGDKRILIESMPFSIGNERFFCYDKGSLSRVMQKTGLSFCLDLAHSSEAASRLGMDIIPFIKDLISLGPSHYHISDTILGSRKDLHLDLGKGDLPIKQFLELLPEDAWLTLESYPFNDSAEENIRFIREAL